MSGLVREPSGEEYEDEQGMPWEEQIDPEILESIEHDREEEELGYACCFPGTCLMPGEHLMSECHTVEMMEAIEEENLEDR